MKLTIRTNPPGAVDFVVTDQEKTTVWTLKPKTPRKRSASILLEVAEALGVFSDGDEPPVKRPTFDDRPDYVREYSDHIQGVGDNGVEYDVNLINVPQQTEEESFAALQAKAAHVTTSWLENDSDDLPKMDMGKGEPVEW